MGWCSGTEIFDKVLSTTLEYVPEDKKRDVIWAIAESLWDGDWDCESDSEFYYLLLPLMHEAGMVDDEEYRYQLENIPEAQPPA
jgi:hypothetical protein